jgi:hypothetical protein
MTTENKSILRLIKLSYEGEELEAMLKAWNDFPTYKTDCQQEAKLKEDLRKLRMKKYLSLQANKVN